MTAGRTVAPIFSRANQNNNLIKQLVRMGA